MFRVLIGLPTQSEVRAKFAYDFGKMMGYIGATLIGPNHPVEAVRIFNVEGTIIPDQRTDIVRQALGWNATHILWIDSDMRFPKESLSHLLARNKPIIAANYSGRRGVFGTTALRRIDDPPFEVVYTYPTSKGIEEVDAVGMGLMLTSTEVFKKLPEPWFDMRWVKDAAGVWKLGGEDIAFCTAARKNGFPVVIDHDLSQAIKHIGTMEYTHDHAIAMKPMLKEERPDLLVLDDPPPVKLVLEA